MVVVVGAVAAHGPHHCTEAAAKCGDKDERGAPGGTGVRKSGSMAVEPVPATLLQLLFVKILLGWWWGLFMEKPAAAPLIMDGGPPRPWPSPGAGGLVPMRAWSLEEGEGG